jgi:hypothetical protein
VYVRHWLAAHGLHLCLCLKDRTRPTKLQIRQPRAAVDKGKYFPTPCQ